MIHAIEPKAPSHRIDHANEKHQPPRGKQKRKHDDSQEAREAAVFELSQKQTGEEDGLHIRLLASDTASPPDAENDVGQSLDVNA